MGTYNRRGCVSTATRPSHGKPISMSLRLPHHKCGRTRKLTILPYSARVDRPLVYDTEALRSTPRRGQLPEPLSIGYAFDDGPNYTHITISRARSRKRQYSTSEVVFSQCVIADGHQVCNRECFRFLGTCSPEVDFSGRHLVTSLQ